MINVFIRSECKLSGSGLLRLVQDAHAEAISESTASNLKAIACFHMRTTVRTPLAPNGHPSYVYQKNFNLLHRIFGVKLSSPYTSI